MIRNEHHREAAEHLQPADGPAVPLGGQLEVEQRGERKHFGIFDVILSQIPMQVLADVWRKFHQPDKDEEQPQQDRQALEHYRTHTLGVCCAGRGHACGLLGATGRHGCLGLLTMMVVITVGLCVVFVLLV